MCSLESELERKPEFRLLLGKALCKQSIEIQTVAITSDNTREVVYRVLTEHDSSHLWVWLSSFERLKARLTGLSFAAKAKSIEPPEFTREPGCRYWNYELVDPEDGQSFSAKWEQREVWDCAIGMKALTLYGSAATRQFAETHARSLRLDESPQWQNLDYRSALNRSRLGQPREFGPDEIVHFQRLDDGWKIKGR